MNTVANARAMRWSPLMAATATALGVGALADWSPAPAEFTEDASRGAGALVVGLGAAFLVDEPDRDVLDATPTGRRTRRVEQLLLAALGITVAALVAGTGAPLRLASMAAVALAIAAARDVTVAVPAVLAIAALVLVTRHELWPPAVPVLVVAVAGFAVASRDPARR